MVDSGSANTITTANIKALPVSWSFFLFYILILVLYEVQFNQNTIWNKIRLVWGGRVVSYLLGAKIQLSGQLVGIDTNWWVHFGTSFCIQSFPYLREPEYWKWRQESISALQYIWIWPILCWEIILWNFLFIEKCRRLIGLFASHTINSMECRTFEYLLKITITKN